MKWIAILVMACGGGGDSRDPVPTTPPTPAPVAKPDATAAAPMDAPWETGDPRDEEQSRIQGVLNDYFDRTYGKNHTDASVSDDDLVIVVWKGECNRKLLDDLQKKAVELKVPLTPAFDTIQCVNTGPVVKLKR